MCSILGYLGHNGVPPELSKINETLAHRGPDQRGSASGEGYALAHNRLAVIDVENGRQPMRAVNNGFLYNIVYNGELYNTAELRSELLREGAVFETRCDTEVVLWAYIIWGGGCAARFNGIFAFAVHDGRLEKTYICRDRFGVKPFFYTLAGGGFLFASEIKALLAFPGVRAVLKPEGLWQLLYLMPIRPEGSAVLNGISELPPASHGYFGREGLKIEKYWSLKAEDIKDGEAEAVEKTRFILRDAIERQLVSDVPLCTFLSGGLDSSVITAVAARDYAIRGEKLSTYSFEHEDNKKYFMNTGFQPQSDDEYASRLATALGTEHTVLTAGVREQAELLLQAVRYRDYPGMADIDSSLLYYCRMVKKRHTVAISGECSDEIFGGYPWFYKPEMLRSSYFPWIHDPHVRAGLFKPEIVRPREGFAYAKGVYAKSERECPMTGNENDSMRQSRIASWFSINYFMLSLLERKDRMSMASGVEVRVPFADHRLAEYVFNVPWEIKFKNNVEKWLLREAMKDYLPDFILNRKKSPYPKTHSPEYSKIVFGMLAESLESDDSRLPGLLCPGAIEELAMGENKTWFGQLMGSPQLAAWLLQLDYWLKTYDITLEM